ncbi:hypothetical protein OAV71_06325 [Opitutales bacterium]|nr:hypothetical protein [Opitutales bacterium]
MPHKQFKKKAWVQANLNGDMILTWEEELIWQYNLSDQTMTTKNNLGIIDISQPNI